MPDKSIYFEMTKARKEHWKRVSNNVIDLVRSEFDSPIEAYAVLNFVIGALQDMYDIKGSFTVKERIQ
jgi:hypothetical protein